MEIREALEYIKEKKDVNGQVALAMAIGVSQGQISKYMKGGTYPNLSTAARIWGKYGIRCEPFTEKALEKEWKYMTRMGIARESELES